MGWERKIKCDDVKQLTPQHFCSIPVICVIVTLFCITGYSFGSAPACTNEQLGRLWPDRSDPTRFFQCTGVGTWKHRPCAPGTRFSDFHQVCVHPWMWQPPGEDPCTTTQQPSTTESTATETTTTKLPTKPSVRPTWPTRPTRPTRPTQTPTEPSTWPTPPAETDAPIVEPTTEEWTTEEVPTESETTEDWEITTDDWTEEPPTHKPPTQQPTQRPSGEHPTDHTPIPRPGTLCLRLIAFRLDIEWTIF